MTRVKSVKCRLQVPRSAVLNWFGGKSCLQCPHNCWAVAVETRNWHFSDLTQQWSLLKTMRMSRPGEVEIFERFFPTAGLQPKRIVLVKWVKNGYNSLNFLNYHELFAWHLCNFSIRENECEWVSACHTRLYIRINRQTVNTVLISLSLLPTRYKTAFQSINDKFFCVVNLIMNSYHLVINWLWSGNCCNKWVVKV